MTAKLSTVCAKVNPFLERVYSADRALHPLRRIGAKGEGRFERVSWDEALADIGSRMKEAIARHRADDGAPLQLCRLARAVAVCL
jgi:anaerobic selenocysteine-containing dehydrogenase